MYVENSTKNSRLLTGSMKRFVTVMCPMNGMTTSTKVLIAEEHLLMAQGLRKLLESEFENVEILENGRDLFSTVASFKPDVILLDGGLVQSNGMEPARYYHNLA